MKLISAAVACCFASHLAFANPTGPTVVNGQVTFQQQGNLLQITNSPSSIINWQSFSIGSSEITRFLQQSASSAVLNRVITQNPSSILGALQSNGRVFLINPNGILFGAGAQVDVAGLVASSLNLSDTDFLAGRLRFAEVPGAGSIINQGAINAASGGQVYLVGPAVTNSGIITSPKGEVILAAGNSVELVAPGTPNLRIEITAPDNQAINLGQIVADSGRVGIYAGLITQSGMIRADSAVVTEDGRIVLKATKGVNLEAGSVTAASGVKGGNVTVETETGTIRIAGQIDATGSEAGGVINIAVTGDSGGIDLGAGLNAGNAAINLSGPGSTIFLNADMTTAGMAITLNDNVELGDPALITLDTTNGGANPGGANVIITGSVNDIGDATGLVLNAGSVGINTLGGAVGNSTPIASLTTSGSTTAINGGLVNTTGNQSYNGPVTLGMATTLAATAPTANIAINSSLSGGANSLTMNAGREITIGGVVSSGPQTVNAGGGLIVQSSAASPAQLIATGGQTINARFIDVTAQDGNAAGISNFTSGDQVITVAGGGSSPGIDARSLASGGQASIGNNAPGAAQTIIVTDADHINVNGFGPTNLSNVSAIIHAIPGTQIISITGSGANAINVGSAGAMGGSNINASDQSITAGASGQSGSITIVGPAVNSHSAAISTNLGFPGAQTLSTSGALTVTGGNAPAQNFLSSVNHNSSGPQSVTAASITLQGGLTGAGNGVQIRSASGPQYFTVGTGGISLTGGSGGSNNGAFISGAIQTIATTGSVTLSGGTGSGNGIRLGGPSGAATDLTLSAGGDVVLTSGSASGTAPVIGNVNSGGAQPTNIAINAGGSVILNAGSLSGARIGQAENVLGAGGNISITSGGNIQLNGTAQPARIRTEGNVELQAGEPGGMINASGNGFVRANQLTTTSSAGTSLTGPNQVSSFNALNTATGDVALRNTSPLLTVTGVSQVPSGALTLTQTGNLTLTGTIGSGPQTITATGDISVMPSSPVIVRAFGPQTITAGGTLNVQGGAGSGQTAQILGSAGQTINASSIAVTGGSVGNSSFAEIRQTGPGAGQALTVSDSITITGGASGTNNFARIRNDGTGTQTISGSPTITLTGGTGGAPDQGNFAQIRATVGPQTIAAGDTSLTAGASGFSNNAIIQSPTQVITIDGDLTMTGGGSTSGVAGGSGARIGGLGAMQSSGVLTAPPGPTDLTLAVSGNATLSGGSSSGAAIGSSTLGGTAPASIAMTVGGDLTLNTGLGAGVRIGSSSSNLVPGNIMIDAGTSGAGDIVINGGTGIHTLGEIVISTAGNLTLTGGTGTNRPARILSAGNQTVSANNIVLTGGSVGNSSFAEIRQAGPGAGQSITASDSITIMGGPSGTNNFVRIRNDGTGPQTISGSPAITITGGSGGLPDQGNNAQIRSVGPQVITAGPTTLTAGPFGFNNFANIASPDQNITVHGDLTLTGGGSSTSATSSADARIGGTGVAGGMASATNLNLVVDGNLTMNGGAATNAGAVIGSNFLGGQPTDITMNVSGNLTLGTGTTALSSARIGSPNTNPAGGDISIIAGGNITLNNATVTGTRSVIRTLDSLTLYANNITVGGSLFSGAQTINAAGNFTVAAPNAVNAVATATGPQTINASGTLTVQGGAGTGLSAQILGAAGQTISASNITVTGGSVGSSSFAQILQTGAGAGQAITINNGGAITLQGGPSGTDNFARIRNEGAGLQSISGSPAITLFGGTGGAPDLGNRAQIIATVGPQSITAGNTALTAGGAGFNNFAQIQSPMQDITVHGDLTLTGGASASSAIRGGGARIGGLGVPPGTPTNLMLNVDGDVTMTGGSMANAGAVIGSSFLGGQPTDITMNVGGNLTMNPGTVDFAGSRIGSPSGNPAGGNISVTAGGDIVLNSAPGLQGSVIRTTESIALEANSIVQGPNARINASSLATKTANGASLAGANQVGVFNATNTASGDVVLNNGSSLLTVTGVSQIPTGALTLNQAGDLAVTGNVFSGPQTFIATGDMSVGADANSVILYAAGPQAINASGTPNASPYALGIGLLDRVAGHGPIDITARSLSLRGGSEFGSFAMITGGPINITTTGVPRSPVDLGTGDFSITGGSGLGAFGWVLSSQNVNLTVGGNLKLDSGPGLLSFARMQTVQPTSVINVYFPNLSEGGYFVNGVEGAYRDGLTGFFAGPTAAKPGKRLITTYGE